MKNKILGSLFLFSIVAFSSCEKDNDCIYKDKRLCDPNYIPAVTEGIVDFSEDLSNYQSTVLLEDFTGYRCTNCPPATATAANLKAQFGDRLVVSAVHCTPYFAGPLNDDTDYFKLDFRTGEGEQYFEDFLFMGLPGGLVNRTKDNNDLYPIMYAEWEQRIVELLDEPARAYVDIKDISFQGDDTLVVAVYAKELNNLEGDYNLTVGIIEDGIAEAQKYPTETVYDYTHNHVFRGNVNGPYGSPAFSGDDILAADKVNSFVVKIPVEPEWNIENCHVISYISNSQTREVIQVDEKKVQ